MTLERDKGETRIFGFLVGVEIQDDIVSIDEVSMKLADAATFVEGVGNVTVDVLGEVEIVDETPEDFVSFPAGKVN